MSAQLKILGALVLGAGLAGAPGLQAADKIELKGSTSLELPKPTRSLDDSRFKFDTSDSMDAAGFLPAPSGGNTAPIDRKLKEMMDKKKNWIFVNPYEQKYDDRTSEILETDKSSSPLLEHRLLQDEKKTAMQKFVEEKDAKGRQDDNLRGAEARDARQDKADNLAAQGSSTFGDAKPEDRPVALFFGSDNSVFKPREYGPGSSSFERSMEGGPSEGGIFSQGRLTEAPKAERPETIRQQETREADFNRLLQNRGTIEAASPTAGTRLEAAFNPSLDSRRAESGAGPGRALQFGTGARPDFGAANRSGGPAGLPANLPGSSGPDLGDFNPRINSGPSFLPGSSGISAAPSGPSFSTQPFVHELPRRKF